MRALSNFWLALLCVVAGGMNNSELGKLFAGNAEA
jgi:hypothetical protein